MMCLLVLKKQFTALKHFIVSVQWKTISAPLNVAKQRLVVSKHKKRYIENIGISFSACIFRTYNAKN